MSETILQLRAVFDEALRLAEIKNMDYGDAWRDQGWRGNLSRVFEKTKRLRNLLWRGDAQPAAVAEGTRETAIDLLNSIAFFIINSDSGVEWGHETPWDAVSLEPKWDLDRPTYPPVAGTDLGLRPETVAQIHDGINSVTNTEPNGLPLPVRTPGEEGPGESKHGNRKSPTPGRRNIPAAPKA